MNTRIRAAIFDLDGTLLNTLTDLADSGNAALAQLALPQHSVEDYRLFVGSGVPELCRRMLPEGRRSPEDVSRALELFGKEYTARWKNKTRPYPGIEKLLAGLCGRGLPTCVLSNKPQMYTDLTIKNFFPNVPFTEVRGQREGTPRKPHPAGALAIAQKLNLAPKSIVFVGDSATDMETACAAGMLPVGVLWGYRDDTELMRTGAAYVIKHPAQLFDVLAILEQ